LALAVDPANASTLYAGTPFGGVYASTNGGTSWSPITDGLTSLDVSALAVAGDDVSTPYAGARGVFALVPACTPTSGCGPCARCDVDTDACVVEPLPDCLRPTVAGKSQLQMKRGRRATSDALVWTWPKGAATDPADFGDPTAGDDYTLCIFDRSGIEPELLLGAAAPAAGTCGRRGCWRGRGRPPGDRGYKYTDREATPDGLTAVDLKPGIDGKAKIAVKGKGANLALPAMPLPLPLLVQLQRTGGGCWEAEYDASGLSRNDDKQLRVKAAP
jgi:hypothetical protein